MKQFFAFALWATCLLGFFSVSCAQTPNKPSASRLVGTWVSEKMSYKIDATPENADALVRYKSPEDMLATAMNEATNVMKSRVVFVFEKNGAVTIHSSVDYQKKETKGTWALKENTLTFQMNDTDVQERFSGSQIVLAGKTLELHFMNKKGIAGVMEAVPIMHFKKGKMKEFIKEPMDKDAMMLKRKKKVKVFEDGRLKAPPAITTTKIIVDAQYVACGESKTCLRIKGETEQTWKTLEKPIEGFQFEEGNEYVLLVKMTQYATTTEPIIECTLIKVISKIKK